MKNTQIWIILFFAAVIGIKIWAGFHGQTTRADQFSEIAGFVCLLTGAVMCFLFGEINKRRFNRLGLEVTAAELARNNYLAILFQGILFFIVGILAFFLKWFIAAVVTAPFLLLILMLFFRGWPSFHLDRDAVDRSVKRTWPEHIT